MANPALVRKPIPNYELAPIQQRVEETIVKREVDYDSLDIKELLKQAQDLYSVVDPASKQISRIKSTIITKLSPVYTSDNQLQLFDNQNGYAIRDPNNPNQIIVQHPEMSLQFRLKKVEATQWKVVGRSISQELERRNVRRQELNSLSQSQTTLADTRELTYINGFTDALNWVIEQTQQRITHRLTGNFVAIPEKVSQGD